MTRYLAVLTALLALALPAEALAKEPVKVTVCGSNGCASSTDKDAILPLVEGGPPAPKLPSAGAPAYRLRITISVDDGSSAQRPKTDTFTNWMSPTLRLVRGSEGTWMTMPSTTLDALRRVARDIRPFPAPRLPLSGRTPGTADGALPPQTYAPALERSTATASSGGTDWPLVAAITGGLAALTLAAVAVARRRRSHPPTGAAPVA
jgi:MYXO-CTERM domain-containing protein